MLLVKFYVQLCGDEVKKTRLDKDLKTLMMDKYIPARSAVVMNQVPYRSELAENRGTRSVFMHTTNQTSNTNKRHGAEK